MPFPEGTVQARRTKLWRSVFFVAASIVLAGSLIDTGTSAVSGIDDKLQHLLAFAGLAATATLGFPRLSVWAILLPALLVYGLAIECIQWFLPWREFSLLDLAADAAGAVPGVLAAQTWQCRSRTREEDAA